MVYVLRSTGIPTLGTAENGNNTDRREVELPLGLNIKTFKEV